MGHSRADRSRPKSCLFHKAPADNSKKLPWRNCYRGPVTTQEPRCSNSKTVTKFAHTHPGSCAIPFKVWSVEIQPVRSTERDAGGGIISCEGANHWLPPRYERVSQAPELPPESHRSAAGGEYEGYAERARRPVCAETPGNHDPWRRHN